MSTPPFLWMRLAAALGAIAAAVLDGARACAQQADAVAFAASGAPLLQAGVEQAPAPILAWQRDQAEAPNPLRAAVAPATSPDPAASGPTAYAVEVPPEPNRYDAAVQVALAEEPAVSSAVDAASATAVPTLPEASLAPAPTMPPVYESDSYDAAAYDAASHDAAPYDAATLAAADEVESRRLAPPSAAAPTHADGQSRSGLSLSGALSPLTSMSSAGAGLAIVVGLFLACTWLWRRGGGATPGVLPAEAFVVLGRAPLTSQSFAQLLRIGNKLVLVSVSADGARPLAEVTDPLEVDRIAGLCVSDRPGGSSAEFQQVLAQLSREPARGFLGREGSTARRRA